MAEEFLRVEHLSKSFAGVQAVQDVSFTIQHGEIRCLVGENGSGKSTLIKMIVGVYKPDQGSISIEDRTYHALQPIEAIREGIQVIYQDFSLFPNLTVAENLAINHYLESRKQIINWRTVRDIAREALDRIGVEIDLDAIVGDLSVADRQLIAISRALLQNARLIIMDEPTTALTQTEVERLFELINALKARGISILFVSHKLSEVQAIADTVMVLRNGHKVADGPAEEFDLASMAYFMTGREITETGYEYQASAGPQPLLQVENLTRPGSFEDVSFSLRPGEIVGVTGLLGSGRTDLAEALFGVRPATAGQITVKGKPVRIRSIQDALRHGIGYVPEDRLTQGLFLPRSIGKNLTIGVLNELSNALGFLRPRQIQQTTEQWIDSLNIKTPSAALPVQSLSGGNQQRVVIGKWLASQPRILVLNGPTVGVDVGSKMELHDTIKALARGGMGLVVISDDIPELLHTCNRVLLMRGGRIVESFDTDTITEDLLNLKIKQAVEPTPAA